MVNYMLCLDICSGLGGFSEAFIDKGHDVIRIDNNIKFSRIPNTIIGTVQHLPLKTNLRPDILLMSPPCTFLSVASAHKNWKKKIPQNQNTIHALRVVFWCLDAVDYLKPRYWVLENPKGMLNKVLGKSDILTYFASWGERVLKPTDLWGDIPPGILWKTPTVWENWDDVRGKSSEIRAKIPYDLSLAICEAMEMITPGSL